MLPRRKSLLEPLSLTPPPPPVHLSLEASLGANLGITPPASIEVDADEVRVRAYQRFLEREGGTGSADQDWLEAERELRERRWNFAD